MLKVNRKRMIQRIYSQPVIHSKANAVNYSFLSLQQVIHSFAFIHLLMDDFSMITGMEVFHCFASMHEGIHAKCSY